MVNIAEFFTNKGTDRPPYPAAQIANFFIQKSGGTFTPLKLQKLVYLSQMVNVGRTNQSLIQEPVEAWNYGPVIPSLYYELKHYGSDAVKSPIPLMEGSFTEEVNALLEGIYATFGSAPPSSLVALTHFKGGAWDEAYREGEKHIVISLKAMSDEFKKLTT